MTDRAIASPARGTGRARGQRRAPLSLLVPAAVAAGVALLPLWYLLDRALARGAADAADELFQGRTFALVTRSMLLTATVTVMCVMVGVAAAWLAVRSDLPGRRLLQVLLALPLAIPSYVSAYAWVSWKPSLAGFQGASLVLVLSTYPYVYLPVAAALSRLDPAQEELARSLGHSPARVAFGLTLRQIRPAILVGALLVALYVLSDFGAVGTMRYEVFTWVIYGAYRAGFNPSRAAVLALVLVAVAALLVALEAWMRGSASYSRVGSGAPRQQRPVHLGRVQPLGWAFMTVLLGASIGFPVVRVIYWMQRGASSAGADVGTALWGTVRISAMAAAASVALAVPVGVLAARYRTRTVRALEQSTYVAHALPGIVVAISLVFVGARLLRPIYQEVPLLVLAYVVLFLPLAVGAVRSSVGQSNVRLEEVARSLGHTPRRVLFRLTVPLALPGIGAGAAMVFLTAMKELPATLLLRPTGFESLATQIWRHTSVSDFAAAGPYALALMLVAALPTALLSTAAARRSERRDRPDALDPLTRGET